MNKFSDYVFRDETRRFLQAEGFVSPTPIQKEVLPFALKGNDIIGISDTGTGKTHAFLIPILEKADPSKDQVQAVITAPTRELATQIYQRSLKMAEVFPALRIRLIIGGMERSRMSEMLKVQPHIVIGTPGRIRDLFLKEKTLRVERAGIFVVDEADMTMELGFLDDVDAIAGKMNRHLQMMSFSATIPQQLQLFLKKYMHAPHIVKIEENSDFHPHIEHVLVPCRQHAYEDVLMKIVPLIQPYICLIFANTRTEAASAAQRMRDGGYEVIELHGDLTPRARQKAMKELQQLHKSYVVATDIAARGIDIEGVTHVISLGFPKELDFYIHRSGRTGRAGKDGICYALYQKQDEASIRSLMTKGIGFHHRTLRNDEWAELPGLFVKKEKKEDPLEKEIAKIVSKKKKKVKPGYKVKRNKEIEKLKRKKKRELIRTEINKQKKERAKASVREKRGY